MLLPVSAQTREPASASYEWLPVIREKFDNPIFLTNAGDGSGRIFVVEQAGYIWIVKDGVVNKEPFLDISEQLPDEVFRGGYTERGLLGLAFHPNYKTNGQFFITYTRRDSLNILARYHVSAADPDRADPASEQIVLQYQHPEMNHNGGMLAFGHDSYLYMGVGDGGGYQGDPDGNAQNKASLLGKILRIDVNSDPYSIPADNPFVNESGARPEIWVLGLRNPWRFSFDRATGDLYIGDVGWAQHEEVDVLPAGVGGVNFGWNSFEATHLLDGRTDPGGVTMPVTEYEHTDGACSITGGYVYHGPGAPTLRGVYVFGDYCNGRVWALFRNEAGEWQTKRLMDTGLQISSFGEDEQGGLYLVTYKGYIYRLREL
ncbi:MAG: PQQ-dependent sugar dehydrogenase [Anaerolineae bacterium]|nr:PQQ-dependent sugar dehydrogenase [Anaerolineae bacterium]